jgi:hypothetical protein
METGGLRFKARTKREREREKGALYMKKREQKCVAEKY